MVRQYITLTKMQTMSRQHKLMLTAQKQNTVKYRETWPRTSVRFKTQSILFVASL